MTQQERDMLNQIHSGLTDMWRNVWDVKEAIDKIQQVIEAMLEADLVAKENEAARVSV